MLCPQCIIAHLLLMLGTNCASLVAGLFLFCYEREFMESPSRESQVDIIEAFSSTPRYLDDLFGIVHFEQMVDRIYPAELQLNEPRQANLCLQAFRHDKF